MLITEQADVEGRKSEMPYKQKESLASLFAQRRNFVLHLSPLHTHLLSLL
jgi:hypothetical protein